MKNRLIMFDFFGVISTEIAPFLFANHFDEQTAVKLKEDFFVPADLGEVTLDDVFDRLAVLLDMPRAEVVEEWNSYIHINFPLVEYIKRLHAVADVALVSNAPYGLVEGIMTKYGIDGIFDKRFISCNLHLAKPDPAIYVHCINSMGKHYDEMYMIDDNPANLAPLPRLGVTPVRYVNFDSVRNVFDKLL